MYYEEEKSNFILCVIGAILGDVLGIILYLVIYRFNIWGFIGAAFLCTFVFRGYHLLNRTMDVKGLIICSLICIVSIYPTELAAVTFDLINQMKKQDVDMTGVSYWKLYKRVPSLMPVLGSDYKFMYWLEVIIGYVMVIAMLIDYIFKKGVRLRRQDDYSGYNLVGRDYASTDQDSENYTSESYTSENYTSGNYTSGNYDENPSDRNNLL